MECEIEMEWVEAGAEGGGRNETFRHGAKTRESSIVVIELQRLQVDGGMTANNVLLQFQADIANVCVSK